MVILNLLVKPVWVLMEMEIQDQVGHEAWGLYGALLSLGYLLLTFADLGINQYSTKTLASNPSLLQTYFPVLFSAKLLLTLLYPFLMMLVGWALGYREEALYLLFLLCLVQGGNQLAQFFRANFQALQQFRIDAWLSVAERIILIGFVIGLFYTGLTLEGFVMARILAVVLTIVLFSVLLARHHGVFKPRWEFERIKEVVGLSLSFALMTILYSVHDKIDQVMVERLAGRVENGLYAGAYRWLEAFSMYLWIVLPIFFARFAYHLKDLKEQERLLSFGQKITAIPLMFVSAFVFVYGEKLLFLFDDSSPEQIQVMTTCLSILFLTVFVNSLFSIFSTLLTSTGYVKQVNVIIIAGIALNIVANAIYIPEYGAIASAWTTVASYVSMNIAYLIYIQTKTSIHIPYRQIAVLLLLGGIGVGAFFGMDSFSLEWWLVTLIAGILYLLATWLLKLIRPDDLKALRKS